MQSDITRKIMRIRSKESKTGAAGRKDCHKPAIRQQTEQKASHWTTAYRAQLLIGVIQTDILINKKTQFQNNIFIKKCLTAAITSDEGVMLLGLFICMQVYESISIQFFRVAWHDPKRKCLDFGSDLDSCGFWDSLPLGDKTLLCSTGGSTILSRGLRGLVACS